jgi:hypothetical protein
MEDEQQDWRLEVAVEGAHKLHSQLQHDDALGAGVVLSYDDDTLFAYAPTRAAIETARHAIEARLDGTPASVTLSHWDDDLGDGGDWWRVDPPHTPAEAERMRAEHEAGAARERAEQEADERVETRTVVITSGRVVRGWFESTVADEAREQGVELEIVEHPHLLTTQIAFTLTGPTSKVESVITDLRARAFETTRFENVFWK